MLNTETDDMDMESFMANLAQDAAKFAPGKREHFMHVMHYLVDCYQSDAKQGIVLLRDGASESETMTLMAINADPSQADDMIDTLCQLRGIGTDHSAGGAVN
jgi:hypothetical protein